MSCSIPSLVGLRFSEYIRLFLAKKGGLVLRCSVENETIVYVTALLAVEGATLDAWVVESLALGNTQ
jgi:hypothetical protein